MPAQYVVAYADPIDHFEHGSIGAETANGIPTLVFKALPVIYAERMGPGGWRHFGFLYKAGDDLPIGFSRRVVDGSRAGLVQLLGLPCRHLRAAR